MSVIEKNDQTRSLLSRRRQTARAVAGRHRVRKSRHRPRHRQGDSVLGPRGVDRILRELIERFGWEPEEQDGNIIALSRDKAQITLEPGGQIELSGEPCESIHCTYGEFNQHIRELLEVCEPLGIVFLGLGMQPVSRSDEIEWVPKQRYRIMGPYMQRSARSASA